MIRDIVVVIACLAAMLTIAVGATLMFSEPTDTGEPVPLLNVTNDKHTCYIPEDMREGL